MRLHRVKVWACYGGLILLAALWPLSLWGAAVDPTFSVGDAIGGCFMLSFAGGIPILIWLDENEHHTFENHQTDAAIRRAKSQWEPKQ